MKGKDERRFFKILKVPLPLKPFILACQKIQDDWNYKPYMTNQKLMSLVMREDNEPKHSLNQIAIAIQPANIKTPSSNEPDSVAMIYQIKIAGYGDRHAYEHEYNEFAPQVWFIDNNFVIAVRRNGEIILCERRNAEKGIFNLPVARKVEEFLNHSSGSLHLECEEQTQERIFNFDITR